MKKACYAIVFLLSFLILNSMGKFEKTNDQKDFSQEITNISVRLPWILNNESAGMQVAQSKGFYRELGLNVEIKPGGMGLDPTQLVANGTDNFGVIDSVSLINAANRDLPVMGIAATFKKTALGIVSINPAIQEFKDLKGKRIGRQPVQEFIVEIMLASAGLKLSDVTGVSIGFDMTPLLENKIDAQIAYISGQPVELQKMNKSPVFFPGNEHGYEFYGNVIVSNKAFLEQNKDIAIRFLQATAKGWGYASQNLNETVDILINNQPDLNHDSQKDGLKILCGLAFPDGDKRPESWGRMKNSFWTKSVNSLKKVGKITDDLTISSFITHLDY